MNWITEKIYGNYAVVYHRTKFNALAEAMYTEGFSPGGGDLYGKGFYATYELASQERADMVNSYGPIVLKAAVPIDKFVFFDWDAFTKTPQAKELHTTKNEFIQAQCERLGIRDSETLERLGIIEQSRFNFDWGAVAELQALKYTSDAALYVVRRTDLLNRAAGIVFTGRTDGQVLVAYRTEIVMPLAVKQDGAAAFTKVPHDQAYLAKMLKAKLMPELPPIEAPLWLQNAEKEHAKVTVLGGEVHWREGTWIDGIWEDGEWDTGDWLGGTWKKGTWNTGRWYAGTWNNGMWGNGSWYGGRWLHGSWASGVWANGTWIDGNWQNGNWYNGTWTNGKWRGGVWHNGEWLYGTWAGGEWEDGNWYAGEWMQGTWKKGVWHTGVWSKGTWFRGLWKIGVHLNGTWKNGTWEDGIWRGGTWKNGVWKNGRWVEGSWLGGTHLNGEWARGLWKNGTWSNGIWEDGTWEDGKWQDGMWKGGIWKKGWIFDPESKGFLEAEWERKDGWTLSPISPADYWDPARMVLK